MEVSAIHGRPMDVFKIEPLKLRILDLDKKIEDYKKYIHSYTTIFDLYFEKYKNKMSIKNIYLNSSKIEIDKLLNITDNDIVIIECDNEIVWIYVTNNNWDKTTYKIDIKEYKNVSFFGPVNIIGNNWLNYCEKLESIDFTGLNSLESVGYDWMSECKNLESIDFNGLSNLETVEYGWFNRCKNLKSIDFTGLSSLKNVGQWWLNYCYNLKSVDFTGLSSLETVGNHSRFELAV